MKSFGMVCAVVLIGWTVINHCKLKDNDVPNPTLVRVVTFLLVVFVNAFALNPQQSWLYALTQSHTLIATTILGFLCYSAKLAQDSL